MAKILAPVPGCVRKASIRFQHVIIFETKYLRSDDLSTRFEHRKRGYAGQLMEWMIDEAKRLHLDEFHLDSGLGDDRADAHRLYFNKGLRIADFHFSRRV